MSAALFHDSITLYLPDGNGGYARRVVDRVKMVFTQAAVTEGSKATVYVPLWSRRSLRYLPEAWDGRTDRFTVRPRDLLVCRREENEMPPADALTVRSVICRKSGSRRLWHLEIQADHGSTYDCSEEVYPDEGTES